MNETQIKKQCNDHLIKNGWIAFRLRSVDGSGWPDSFYIRKGVAMFIEYKTPKGILSDIQLRRIAEIQEQRFDVYVVDSLEHLKKLKL
jgi:hypothetical protein